MAKRLAIPALILVSFLAGVSYRGRPASAGGAAAERKPLYYSCPMHPGYRSDRPGDAPCCGMRLEPVFAGQQPPAPDALSAGLHLTETQQQIGGVRLAPVVRHETHRTIRTTGRVAPDENRLYRINASTEMWIRKIHPATTGTMVAKGQPLCGFYTTNFLTAAQSYLYILNATDRLTAAGQTSTPQLASNDIQLRQAVELLQNLGVSEAQIHEMGKARKAPALADVRSPVDGYILSRKVSLGQWLGPGSEMYEIADLSRVWIYADMFENDARAFRAGVRANVWSPALKVSLNANISAVPPSFDATTRQVRVRLEMENPQRALWPGMFVDVEMPVEALAGITVPADAVVYSGKQKTVYVARGNGYFEPRQVETGWTADEVVEVTRGLHEGEKIVVGGNFLLDSESRMKKAALGGDLSRSAAMPVSNPSAVIDPVCGMDVDPAATAALKSEHAGVTYHFCSQACKSRFQDNPEKYLMNKRPENPAQAKEAGAPKKGRV